MKPSRKKSFFRLTEAAWTRTVAMLFKPFRWGVWWRLLLIAIVSGQLSAGWAGTNFNSNWNQNSSQQPTKPKQPDNAKAPGQGEPEAPEEVISIPQDAKGAEAVNLPASKPKVVTYETIAESLEKARAWVNQHSVIIGFLAVLILAFQVLWTWLAARLAFVFIDVIVTKKVRIAQPFKRWGEVAQSYFKWSLAILALVWTTLIGIAWVTGSALLREYAKTPALPLDDFLKNHAGMLFGSLSGFILGVIVWALLSMIFWVWLIDFVLPIMYHRRCTMLHAWKLYLPLVREAPGEAAKYLLWKMLVAFAFGVAYVLVLLIAMLLAAVLGVIAVLLGVLAAKALPLLNTPLVVLGIFGVLGMIILFVVVMWMLMLPASLVFRTLSLEYLGSLGVGYDLFPEPAA